MAKTAKARKPQMIQVSDIRRGKNDRTVFLESELAKLEESIKEFGLVEPIILRRVKGKNHKFEIVAGERRFRALKKLGRTEIEVGREAIIRDDLDTQIKASVAMLAENLNRHNLDEIDEANAYKARLDEFGWTPEDLAIRVGTTASTVANRLKLLGLRPEVQRLIRSKALQSGYALILADSDLDTNRQMIAVNTLNVAAHPTPVWFRQLCGKLHDQQDHETLFDLPLLSGRPSETPAKPITPPEPRKDKAPAIGSTPEAILIGQIKFWQEARERWVELGRTFKIQECAAIILALQTALAAIRPAMQQERGNGSDRLNKSHKARKSGRKGK